MPFQGLSGSSASASGRVALALFLLAAVPRVHDLSRPSLSTDEVRWIRRGDRMVQTARLGDPWKATAHLSHPGIPAAALIGLSQRWGGRFESVYEPVAAARLPIALVGAAMSPLLYLAAQPLWGAPAAALSAVVLALDPRHLATSRNAHLDVVFGLFYGLAVWAFWRRGEASRDPAAGRRWLVPLGAIGAVALALAEATRTSGVIAGVTILVATAVARARGGRSPVDLGELRWLALAVVLFLLVFGKLWLDPAEIPRRERYPVLPAVERVLDRASTHAPLVLGAAGASLLGGLWFRRRAAGLALFVFAAALGATVAFPDLARNTAGFAHNLVTSPERLHHRYYGESGAPLPGKYLTVLLDGTPTPVFVALLLGFPLFALRSWQDDSRRGRAGVAVAITVVVFLAVASQLDKVAYRYLAPIQPLLALVAGTTLWSVLRVIPVFRRFPAVSIAAVALLLVVDVVPAAPHYPAWRSAGGRWLHESIALPSLLAHEGHDDAASYLWRHAAPSDRVAALCYDDVLRYYWDHVLPERSGGERRPMPLIGYYRIDEADFLVLSSRRRPTAPPEVRRFAESHEPVVRVEVEGEVALEVFDVAATRREGEGG